MFVRNEKPLKKEELESLLDKLAKWDALEMQENKTTKEVYMPYVMNDAVECFLRFTDCVIHGKIEEQYPDDIQVELVCDDDTKGLIIRQSSGNTVSIWYKNAYIETHCYQYHLIGHAWRKKSGEEDLRRLVNLICVLHDKITYLFSDNIVLDSADQECIELEKKIAFLAEFAPILYFTPINDSILEWYPQSLEGIQAALQLTMEAGDGVYYEEILRYKAAFLKGKIKEKQIRQMAEQLLQPQHRKIWELIDSQIKDASTYWNKRDYGTDKNQRLEQDRSLIQKKYREMGFVGAYPYMTHKDNKKVVKFVEEQAFTVMEAPNFQYHIFAMIFSESGRLEIWKEEATLCFFEKSL